MCYAQPFSVCQISSLKRKVKSRIFWNAGLVAYTLSLAACMHARSIFVLVRIVLTQNLRMFISNLQEGVDDYVERLVNVYESGLSSLPTSNISSKLAAGGQGWKILRRATLGAKTPKSPKGFLDEHVRTVFRGWLLSEGCPKELLTGASEAHPNRFNSITVQAVSFGEPLLESVSERERRWGITGRTGRITGQHAGGQEHRWRKLSFTILDDGRLMAVLHEIEHLSKGPKSLGRVVHNASLIAQGKLHAGLVQTWPVCQADVIASRRTTGISFFVEGEQGDFREIHLAMDQHTATLIAPVLQDHISNLARAVEHGCQSQNLHESAHPSVAFSARHHINITRDDARLSDSDVPKDSQRGRRMIDNFMDELESPMQELLRKVNEIQEQLHEIASVRDDMASVKDDIRELKAVVVTFSLLPCFLESKSCDFTCERLLLS